MTSARAMEIRDRLAAEAERRRRVRRDRLAALPDEPLASGNDPFAGMAGGQCDAGEERKRA